MLFAVSVGMLGYTRIQSVVCYNSETRAFDELTPALARRGIESGQVKGVLWQGNGGEDENGGMFVPDKEGFNKQNIMVKTAAAKFRPLLSDLPGLPVNSMYNVVRVLETNYRGTLYEIVSNRYDRIKVTEQQLRNLNDISPVAGVWITENEIKIADGIKTEDRTGKVTTEVVEPVEPVEQMETVENEVDTEPAKESLSENAEVTVESEVENTEDNDKVTMDAIFGEVGKIVVTEEMQEQAYSVESGAGATVSQTEAKVEEKAVGSKPASKGKKKK